MLKIDAENSYYQFDQWGMLIVPTDSLSHRDSIGRTVLAWIVYGRPLELQVSLDKCLWKKTDSIKWQLKRHPNHKEKASRDHWSYFIIFEKLFEPQMVFKWFILDVPFMRGLYFWMKSLTGNKLAERLYYLIYIPGALIGNIWLRICRWVGRIRPERDNRWWTGYNTMRWVEIMNANNNGWKLQNSRTPWQKIWGRIISVSIPAYALHNKAWQIYIMPDSKRKERLKRILLKRVGKSNIMLRLLFGDTTVTQQEVDLYPHLTGYRPGVYLNTTRRTIRELTEQEAEFNTYEKQLIKKLYNGKLPNTRI